MVHTLLAWLLRAMLVLAPDRDHMIMATAIAEEVSENPPLFKVDEDKSKTMSLLTAIAFREGGFRTSVVGDHGGSFCTFQVNRSVGGSAKLNEDPRLCVRTAMAILRDSMRNCPEHPIALYASGPRGCDNLRAQRISKDRMAMAAMLKRKVAFPVSDE